jgi:hypothetical protein
LRRLGDAPRQRRPRGRVHFGDQQLQHVVVNPDLFGRIVTGIGQKKISDLAQHRGGVGRALGDRLLQVGDEICCQQGLSSSRGCTLQPAQEALPIHILGAVNAALDAFRAPGATSD